MYCNGIGNKHWCTYSLFPIFCSTSLYVWSSLGFLSTSCNYLSIWWKNMFSFCFLSINSSSYNLSPFAYLNRLFFRHSVFSIFSVVLSSLIININRFTLMTSRINLSIITLSVVYPCVHPFELNIIVSWHEWLCFVIKLLFEFVKIF